MRPNPNVLPLLRYTLTQPEAVQKRFQTNISLSGEPNYNCHPGKGYPFVYAHKDGFNALHLGAFGLVPPHETRTRPESFLLARSDTILEKPTFRDAFRTHRCLVVADGFYVWKSAQPYYVRLKSGVLFGIAGIFARNTQHGFNFDSFAPISTDANTLIEPLHERMFAIIRKEDEAYYLDPSTPIDKVRSLIMPFEEEEMELYKVSRKLNTATNNSENYIFPLKEQTSVVPKVKAKKGRNQLSFLD